MVCENLFRLYGTSSEEIAEKATKKAIEQEKQFYQPQIDKLTDTVNNLTSQVIQLEKLLSQNNIAY